MSEIVYRISALLEPILVSVPKGSNLGLFYLLWALISGKLLASRGALSAALWEMGLPKEAVRRSLAALAYGRFTVNALLCAWHKQIPEQAHFRAHRYEGYAPLACDLVGFFRPRLAGCVSKHYHSQAERALPAMVLAVVAPVGSVGTKRLALPRLLLAAEPGHTSETALMRRALKQANRGLARDEALIVDAGFSLADLLERVMHFGAAESPLGLSARRKVPSMENYSPSLRHGKVICSLY